MDALALGIVWVAVGAALVLLVQEQSQRLSDFTRMQARQREQVAADIREVCNDDECVALYESVAESLPDNLVYYALAETRQRMASEERDVPTSTVFADAIRRVAGEHGCRLQLQATG